MIGDKNKWSRLNKSFFHSVKDDKRNYIEKKLDEIERHTSDDSKTAFGIVKELTKKWVPRMDVINDEDGKTLTESDDIKKRWVQCSTKLFESQDENSDFQLEEPCEVEPPLRSEVELALKQLKDAKSSGIDNIAAEIWKATGEEGIDLMWHLCCRIWQKKEWPLDWCRAVFVPLPKKGNLKEFTNHRTISLICHASKVLLKITIQRMRMKSQQEIADEQAGCRGGRGTRDQIVNIRNVIEKCREHKQPLCLCFIDYSKASDCVSHPQLWTTMKKIGLHVTLLNW